MLWWLTRTALWAPEDGTGGAGSAAPLEAAPETQAEGSPAAPAEVQGAAPEGEGEGGTPGAPSPEAPKPPKKTDWRDRQIAKLRGVQADLEKKLAAKPAAGTLPEAEVETRAQAISAERDYRRSINEIDVKGFADFGDWKDKMADLNGMVNKSDPKEVAAYSSLVAVATRTGKAPEVLHALASDLDLAEQLLGMTPVEQALEIAKLSYGKAAPAMSTAPKPMTQVKPKGAAAEQVSPGDKSRSDQLSTAEYMARRNAEVAAKRAANPGFRLR